MHVVTILGAQRTAIPGAERDALDAWRRDLAELSERRAGLSLLSRWQGPAPVLRLLAIGVAPIAFGAAVAGTGLLSRIDGGALPVQGFMLVPSGLGLILAARWIWQVNDNLYEVTLHSAIVELASQFNGAPRVAGRSGAPLVTVLGKLGLGLVGIGVVEITLAGLIG